MSSTFNLSQIQSEYFQLDIRPFDIAIAPRNIKKGFSYILEDKGISLEIKDGNDSVISLVEETRTMSAITSLEESGYE